MIWLPVPFASANAPVKVSVEGVEGVR